MEEGGAKNDGTAERKDAWEAAKQPVQLIECQSISSR